jgi:FkbM family methyltransferase
MEPRQVADFVGHLSHPRILEIGAHEGRETAAFRQTMPHCEVFALEPDSRPAARFRARHGGDPAVRFYEMAAGSVSGQVTWYASHGQQLSRADWDASGSIKQPTAHLTHFPKVGFTAEERGVRCARLDELFEPGSIDFIWADVQGAQREVIEGGRRLFDSAQYVYIECHPLPMYDGETTIADLCAILPLHNLIAQYGQNLLFQKA